MTLRKIELPLFGKDKFDSLLESARRVAVQFGAKVDVRFIRPSASDAALYDAGYGFASAGLIEQIEEEGKAAAGRAKAQFDSWCGYHGGKAEMSWTEEEGQTGAVVARRGCLADLILLQRAAPKMQAIDEAFEASVFGAGKMVLLVDEKLSERYLDHAMIAWNESTESARAVAQSLPFLAKCGRVSIFAAADEGGDVPDLTDLIDYLALHGVKAQPLVDGPIAGSVKEAMMNVARGAEVTLLVLGAYTHSRVRQMLFGGVTQHVLTTPGLPALMAH